MNLQIRSVYKIDSTFGLPKILNSLEKLKKFSNPDEQELAEIMITYFNLMYETQVNLEQDVLVYKDITLLCYDILIKYANQFNCEVLLFIADLYMHNLTSMNALRLINQRSYSV